ncbi:MAG: triose-phosphate isomerase [Candidatus Kuenenbacteria bacterium]
MIFIANWKMNLTKKESLELTKNIVKKFKNQIEIKKNKLDIILCPSFVSLSDVQKILSNSSIKFGAQNVFWEEKGAFTGEISASMLKKIGCQYVIIGHSERRQYLKETDEIINEKIKICLKFGLKPILCIGEKSLKTNKPSIVEQLKKDLKGISQKKIEKIIIAYEPIWAISTNSTGKICSPKRAVEKIKIIRKTISDFFNLAQNQKIKILYGGSVNHANIKSFTDQSDIDGVLVGGASLKINEVVKMIEQIELLKHKNIKT